MTRPQTDEAAQAGKPSLKDDVIATCEKLGFEARRRPACSALPCPARPGPGACGAAAAALRCSPVLSCHATPLCVEELLHCGAPPVPPLPAGLPHACCPATTAPAEAEDSGGGAGRQRGRGLRDLPGLVQGGAAPALKTAPAGGGGSCKPTLEADHGPLRAHAPAPARRTCSSWGSARRGGTRSRLWSARGSCATPAAAGCTSTERRTGSGEPGGAWSRQQQAQHAGREQQPAAALAAERLRRPRPPARPCATSARMHCCPHATACLLRLP